MGRILLQNAGESTGFQVIAGEGGGPGEHDHVEDGMLGFVTSVRERGWAE